jgi:radical SAM protein with 4Fe4S-binding SPASM domain
MNYDGEPLMNRHHIKYLRMAEEKGVGTYFNTNGMLFTEKYADELVSFYKGSVFFSVDGARDWFNRIRIGGDYDRVLKNLDYFLTANKRAGSPVSVGVSLCNLGQTAQERSDFVDNWIDKANFVSLGEVNNKDGSVISEQMTTFEVKNRPVCNVPWQTVGICHNGDVIPCSIYITRANTANAILGNVHEKSIREIWKDKPIQALRKMLADNDIENTYCKTCERWRCQFSWPDKIEGNRRIERNGTWTTVYNLDKALPDCKGG